MVIRSAKLSVSFQCALGIKLHNSLHDFWSVHCILLPAFGDQDRVGLTQPVGNILPASCILPDRGLRKLLDPPVNALQVVLREYPPGASRVHCTHRVCRTIRPLGGGADSRHAIVRWAGYSARTHDHLVALDHPEADGGHWNSQWVRLPCCSSFSYHRELIDASIFKLLIAPLLTG